MTMSDPSLPLPNLDLPASIAEARMLSESGYVNPMPNKIVIAKESNDNEALVKV